MSRLQGQPLSHGGPPFAKVAVNLIVRSRRPWHHGPKTGRASRLPTHSGLLVLVVLLFLLTPGCLFPPVAPPVDEGPEEPRPPEPSPGPEEPGPEPVERRQDWTQSGTIDRGASVAGTSSETDTHTVRLPPHITSLTVRLEWDDEGTYDLDLHVEALLRGEQVWSVSETEGEVGDPDGPIESTFSDLPFFDEDEEVSLNVVIEAKGAVNVRYLAYVEWTHWTP